ncbi:MAG: polyribonucleotide nucleotidyltransferase [Clostridia bacterium]|nr:polyribonucleotide nucleotidyltransferase [Clostridia bacterium]
MLQKRETLVRDLEVAGRRMILETGRLATQANGAVLARYGDTVVLATATSSSEPREGIDFFPLTVDYEERHYAVGKIPGGFIKREGRPSEKAILSARLIDRPIRPLFPKGYRNDVHVVVTVLAVDQDNPPDILALTAASAALTISDIPFAEPIGGVLVGLVDGEIVINPTLAQSEKSQLHLVVAGTHDAVMMVEAGAKEVGESKMLEAIMTGHREVARIAKFINDFREEALSLNLAKPKQEMVVAAEPLEPSLISELQSKSKAVLEAAIREYQRSKPRKLEREKHLEEIKNQIVKEVLDEHGGDDPVQVERTVRAIIEETEKQVLRRMVLEEKVRIDGRQLDEIRPIFCQVGVIPRVHGSGLFTRGETQVLTVATLGAVSDEQILDGLGVEESKRYMHHYNFPPYSVGEARPMRGPGRREIGHGALAERALEAVLPGEEEFPYTIRLVSEVLESNGSTSMASVCGSTLALMDAGVPISAPVAGVAMGLIKGEGEFAVLTDIQGIEDALGDMDFKVAGSAKGITALQMDIKTKGISEEILRSALEEARKGRAQILDSMLGAIPKPRPELSPLAPRIIRMVVDPDKIREVIGPGGKIIKKIIEETGVRIDIEDDGRIFIAASDGESGAKAVSLIQALTQDVEIGKIYSGKVTRITDFGAFVEIIPGVLGLPGKEGMVHISQLSDRRIARVEDVVHQGQEILVKAIGFDQQGRLRLSRKETLPKARARDKRS